MRRSGITSSIRSLPATKPQDELKKLARPKLQSMAKRPQLLRGLFFRCCDAELFNKTTLHFYRTGHKSNSYDEMGTERTFSCNFRPFSSWEPAPASRHRFHFEFVPETPSSATNTLGLLPSPTLKASLILYLTIAGPWSNKWGHMSSFLCRVLHEFTLRSRLCTLLQQPS